MTVLAAMFMIIVIFVVALVIDGGTIRAARRHAGDVAQEAARAAAQQVDEEVRFSTGQIVIHPDRARAAGLNVLSAAGATGTVSVDGTEVTVRATFSTGTALLDEITVTASRTANAQRSN